MQSRDCRGDLEPLALSNINLDIAGFCAVAQEGVRMRFAVDGHAGPAVGDDIDMGGVDVAVFLDKVRSDDRPKNFGGCDGVLFGEDEDCVFDGVCGDDDAVVGFGVSINRLV